jgi:glycogen synthase
MALELIERAFAAAAPDYVEAPDRGASALVPLLARRVGHRLLRDATFGLRLVGSGEIAALHDGTLSLLVNRLLRDLEREQLRLADHAVWPGGDLLGAYRRYYEVELPPAERILEPFGEPPAEPPRPPRRDPAEPLRILFAGDLGRRGGGLDLAAACLRLPRDDWQLTLIGEDSETAPFGQSAWMTIEEMAGGDPRFVLEEPSPEGPSGHFADHDLLAVPPSFAGWPEVALEAMRTGLPILATPVGGLVELVEDGVSGWLTDGFGAGAIRRGLVDLLEEREELERVRASGEVFARFRRLTEPDSVAAGYARLLHERRPPPRAPRASAAEPLVSGIVPYHRASAYVEEAVGSLLAQTHGRLEVLVINDGSFEPADDVLERLGDDPRVRVVTKLNGGDSSARNCGIRLARGEYLAMVDADNALEPEFVKRALAAFAHDPTFAFVSSWLRFVGPDGLPHEEPAGYAPFGNQVVSDEIENWDADALALIPRSLFAEHGFSYEESVGIHSDWDLYRRLRDAGRFGAVIPERLARYRVVPESLRRSFTDATRVRAWKQAVDGRRARSLGWAAEVVDG